MLPISKSAVIRGLRTLLQLGLGWLTVDRVEAWILHLDLAADLKALAVGVAAALLAYAHRRFLDPSRVPSLVDKDPTAGLDLR